MQRQAAFDFDRRDIFAAGDNEVVDAPGDEEIAVGVNKPGVAGEIPAVADSGGVGIGPPPIAFEGFVARDQRCNLAFLALRGGLVGGFRAKPHDAHHLIDAGAAGGAGLARRLLVDGEGVDLGAAVVVDKQVRPERRVELLQERIGHRRAGEAELAHRGHICAREVGMIDQIVIERRHQIKVADPLGGDQVERAGNVELRQADERTADQRHSEQRADAHGVVEGRDAERALAVRVKVLRHVGDGGGPLGAVPARTPFGREVVPEV